MERHIRTKGHKEQIFLILKINENSYVPYDLMFFCFSSGVVTPPLTYKPSTINFLQKKVEMFA